MRKIKLEKIILIYCAAVIFLPVSGEISYADTARFKNYPVLSEKRLDLTREYALRHYGINSYRLEKPKVIVIHYTGNNSLKNSLEYFKPAELWTHRKYIRRFGSVNVGVHFIVARDGTIYSLLPTEIMGRHAIGLNHLSIGIENVAGGENDLTPQQLDADTDLVYQITGKHPSIDSLIGHYEYTRKDLYHFRYFLQLDRKYKPTIKSDPGVYFMDRLRSQLKKKYNLTLKR